MLNAELGKRKGFDYRCSDDFGPSVERKTEGSRETSPARETFATLHGSRDRWRRTGYKIARLIFDKTGKPAGEYEDFMTGFVISDRQVWGRPVAVAAANDGSLLVTDDGSGTIWRIS
jgi:glucose/arabinose dehydrogenase